jgi:hypothetical protein
MTLPFRLSGAANPVWKDHLTGIMHGLPPRTLRQLLEQVGHRHVRLYRSNSFALWYCPTLAHFAQEMRTIGRGCSPSVQAPLLIVRLPSSIS